MQRIKEDRRGISNVVVVILGLVIIVIIVSNVFLWNYEMNQLDWERIHEDISILDAMSLIGSWVYSSSDFTLCGSTSNVSGSISDLASDDGVYMTFRSYDSGTDILDFVDDNVSDVDSSTDKGTHSNFTAQKYGPDSIYDVLIEEETGLTNSTLINAESFEGIWPPASWSANDRWNKESDQAYDGTFSADYDGQGAGSSGELTSPILNCSDAGAAYIDFWYRVDMHSTTESDDFLLQYYNGSSWNTIYDLGFTAQQNQWVHYQEKVSDSQYLISGFRVRWAAVTMNNGEHGYVDHVTIVKEMGTANYELDLEIQWTNGDYTEANETLCIYGGTMGSENIKVDVWNGSDWKPLFSDLSSGWNNISVSSYLTSPSFVIRFKGSNETDDTIQESWNIDTSLLHVWTNQYTSEVEFAGSSNLNYWSQLNWTVDCAWTVGSVNVTLQLYDYALSDYPTSGDGYITYVSNGNPNIDENNNQTIAVNPTRFRNSTGYWKVRVKGIKEMDTRFDLKGDWIEFKVETIGSRFTFENTGSITAHLVSLWIINSTNHQRHNMSLIINSAQTLNYTRTDITLPIGEYTVKIVTKRGNKATYQGS